MSRSFPCTAHLVKPFIHKTQDTEYRRAFHVRTLLGSEKETGVQEVESVSMEMRNDGESTSDWIFRIVRGALAGAHF
jgi:hypothetical protein